MVDSFCKGWVQQNKFSIFEIISFIYIYYINNLFMRAWGEQIWSLNVAVLMMWSWKCEIPTDVHDSHSTVVVPWKNVHGFQCECFSDSAHIWSVANNNNKFLFWPEFRPPVTLHPGSFEAASWGRLKFLKHLLLLFTFSENPFPEHCESKAKCTYNKSPAQKLKHWITVPGQRSNKELRRCQHFLS